jgi:hypothetical protein
MMISSAARDFSHGGALLEPLRAWLLGPHRIALRHHRRRPGTYRALSGRSPLPLRYAGATFFDAPMGQQCADEFLFCDSTVLNKEHAPWPKWIGRLFKPAYGLDQFRIYTSGTHTRERRWSCRTGIE